MYGHLTHWLSSLANGRIILSLEGGYNINSIAHAMTTCTKSLLGDPLPMLESQQVPCTSAIHSINNVLKTQKQYWSNLVYDVSLPKERVLPKAKISSAKEDEAIINGEELSIGLETKISQEMKTKKYRKGPKKYNIWRAMAKAREKDVDELITLMESAILERNQTCSESIDNVTINDKGMIA